MATFYAVRIGRKPGIYKTWPECEAQVKGYPNAVYKKFTDESEALAFIEGKEVKKEFEMKKDVLYAYVDGSYSAERNVAGYGLVLVKNDEVIFKDIGCFKDYEQNESRNVFGEIKGAQKAVELAIANDFKEIVIAYDYEGIEAWATGRWKAKKPLTQDYQEFMQKYAKLINISFHKCKAHSGEKYNEMADKLAKMAISL